MLLQLAVKFMTPVFMDTVYKGLWTILEKTLKSRGYYCPGVFRPVLDNNGCLTSLLTEATKDDDTCLGLDRGPPGLECSEAFFKESTGDS